MLGQLGSASQWYLFLRVLTFAAAVPLLFNLRLSVLSRALERRIQAAPRQGNDATTSDQIIRCVETALAVGKPLVRSRCLIRSVTLYYFLRRAGMDLALCFGAATKEGRLVEGVGHCWLIKDGEPFLEQRDPRMGFIPIYSWPGSGPGVGEPKPKGKTA